MLMWRPLKACMVVSSAWSKNWLVSNVPFLRENKKPYCYYHHRYHYYLCHQTPTNFTKSFALHVTVYRRRMLQTNFKL